MTRNDDYVLITKSMLDLGLSSSELIIFAKISSFSAQGDGFFWGSQGYLASWGNMTQRNLRNCIKKLTEKGLLEIKKVGSKNAYRACIYHGSVHGKY